MQQQDDPEARIRELERPLADVAQTSELGTGYYTSGSANTPTPWPTYGAPTWQAPPKRGGFGAWWLVPALIAAVMLIIGAGFAVFSATMFANESPVITVPDRDPGVVGGGGTFDRAPDAQPSLPGGGPAPAAPSAPTARPDQPLTVLGSGKNETIACNDGTAIVSGTDNTVTITGRCVSLTVSGMRNQVIVDTADAITASGFDNQVTFHSGSPQIDNVGFDNVVQQG